MSWQPSPPLAATSPGELLSGLGPGDRLVGYEAILTSVIDDFGGQDTQACVRASRGESGRQVPSVIVLLEDRVVECWLSGTTVQTASSPRPGAG